MIYLKSFLNKIYNFNNKVTDETKNISINEQKLIKYLIIFITPIIVYIMYNITNDSISIFDKKGDALTYINIAKNFLKGNGLVNTFRKTVPVPGYPLLIAFFIGFFNSTVYIVLFQYILLGFTSILTYKISEKLFPKKIIIGYIAVILFAFSPSLLITGPRFVLIETVYTFFMTLVAFYLIKVIMSWNNTQEFKLNIVILNIIIVISIFFRPHLIIFYFIEYVVCVILLYFKRINKKVFIIITIIPLILFSLNIISNYKNYNEFIPISNYSGYALYIANNPNTKYKKYYYTKNLKENVDHYWYENSTESFSSKNKLLMKYSMNYMLKNPFTTMYRVLYRVYHQYFFGNPNLFDKVVSIALFLGFIICLVRYKNERLIFLILMFYILQYSLLTCLGIMQWDQRYRLPIIPSYIVFSAFLINYSLKYINYFIKKIAQIIISR